MTKEQEEIIDNLALKLKPLIIKEQELSKAHRRLEAEIKSDKDQLISYMKFFEITELPKHKMKLCKYFKKGHYFKILD